MLQRDYLLQQLEQFTNTIIKTLRSALILRTASGIEETEEALGELLELNPAVLMPLTPESFVTMMRLTGVGDATSAHVAYVLERLADAYMLQGDNQTALLRRQQAREVARSFGLDLEAYPKEFEALEKQIAAARGEAAIG
jgi:hypothetical protein